MNHHNALIQVARRQHGFFSSRQAAAAGYGRELQSYHARSGNWLKIDRGIYRLKGFADSLEADFIRWSLWAQGQSRSRSAVISHQSALFYHGLSPMRPESVHLTVDTLRRGRSATGATVHWQPLAPTEILSCGEFQVTSVLRTLEDLKPDLLFGGVWISTVRLAWERGLLGEQDLSHLFGGEWPQGWSANMASRTFTAPACSIRPEESGRAGRLRAPREPGMRQVVGRSFTLVEMLVVIVVILILASLLMPSLRGALASAVKTACGNNIRQVGQAMLSYSGDYNQMLPNHKDPTIGSSSYSFLQYVNNFNHVFPPYGPKESLYCPSLPVNLNVAFMTTAIIAGESPAYRPASDPNGGYARVTVSRVGRYDNTMEPICPPSPSRRVLAGDVFQAYSSSSNWLSTYNPSYSAAHEGIGCNTVYEDGHLVWGSNPLGRIWSTYEEWHSALGCAKGGGPFWGYHWQAMPTVYIGQ